MRHGHPRPRPPYPVAVPSPRATLTALPAALLLVGCSAAADPATATPVSSVPASWLGATAKSWPTSAGHGSSMPVLSSGPCLLAERVEANGATAMPDMSGFGPYGDDPATDAAYRYVCEFRGDDLSAQLQLIQAGSPSDAQRTVELFLGQRTTADQENDASTVEVDGVAVHVNVRWYPGPGYGETTALFHDAETDALVQLEVSSLDEDDLADYLPERAARDLMAQLGRA